MTSHSWLESSLHRSSKLGREVLERARKRSVRWSNTSPYGSRTSLESTGDIHQLDVKKIQEDPVNLHKSLDNAFDRVVEFMDHTSYECKVDQLDPHLHPPPPASQCGPEDFHIVLSPGSYAITAGVPGASPQTQVVRVNPGESMSLTFNI
ncbi:A-kinase-interacting protein 1 isoform X3 [Clupea harengus]|uniref:A-kinase-interacting protein 1 isoform X3 n=1 Tax=Clupea harengus TaxID=7950 RepID=A0A8M1KD12_CLUHA|nr:A-kinase-interacting protein 1 isoform X3 [Clupea harengus]